MLQKVISEAASDYLYDSGWVEVNHTNGTNTILVDNEAFPTNSGKPIVTLVDFRGITTGAPPNYVQPRLLKGSSNVGPSFEGRTNWLKNHFNSTTNSNYLYSVSGGTVMTEGMNWRIAGSINNTYSHVFPDGSLATHTCLQTAAQDFKFYFLITTTASTGTYAYRYRYMDFDKANEVFK